MSIINFILHLLICAVRMKFTRYSVFYLGNAHKIQTTLSTKLVIFYIYESLHCLLQVPFQVLKMATQGY